MDQAMSRFTRAGDLVLYLTLHNDPIAAFIRSGRWHVLPDCPLFLSPRKLTYVVVARVVSLLMYLFPLCVCMCVAACGRKPDFRPFC